MKRFTFWPGIGRRDIPWFATGSLYRALSWIDSETRLDREKRRTVQTHRRSTKDWRHSATRHVTYRCPACQKSHPLAFQCRRLPVGGVA